MAHMHYAGTGKMHSFRGLLLDGAQHKIRIQGSTGEIAWRITKFQLFPASTTDARDSLVKIWREEQSSVTGDADFNNDELLGAALSRNRDQDESEDTVVFDNSLFVRNIYITHFESIGTVAMNYYIELEEVKVSAAGMAQLAVAAARRTID